MRNIAAFFDVDGTIFRNSLLIEHFKMLIKYEFLSTNAWSFSVEEKFNKWAKREGDYEEYMQELVDTYLEGLKNINPNDVDYIAKRVIDLKADKLYRFTRDALETHKKLGHKTILISGSPSFLVEKMAKKLGIDEYTATEYLIENGSYTGEKLPMWDSENKNKAIKEYCQKFDINLEKSYAYGDTAGDYSMLKKVGNPYAINPAKKLINKILSDKELLSKVKIIVERKDVIYNLNPINLDINIMK